MNKMHGVSAAILLALMTQPALAQMSDGQPPSGGRGQGGPGGPGGERKAAERPIERKQLDSFVARMFQAGDTDGDGLITLQEVKSAIQYRKDSAIRARFNAIDHDASGDVSEAEFFAWQHGLGATALSDEHQRIGAGEMVAESIPLEFGNDGEDLVLAPLIEPLSTTVIVSANTDYDTGMSLEELLVFEARRFVELDKDRDGRLTSEEMRLLQPERRGGMPADGPGGASGPSGNGPPPGRPPAR